MKIFKEQNAPAAVRVPGFLGELNLQEIKDFLEVAPDLEQLRIRVQIAQQEFVRFTENFNFQLERGTTATTPFQVAVFELQLARAKVAQAEALCKLEEAREILAFEEELKVVLEEGLATLSKGE